jgi:hypothetical protein
MSHGRPCPLRPVMFLPCSRKIASTVNQPKYAYLVLFHPIDKAVVINENFADIFDLQLRYSAPSLRKTLRERPASKARRTKDEQRDGESRCRYSAATSKSSTAAYDQITLRPIVSSASQLLLGCRPSPPPPLAYLAAPFAAHISGTGFPRGLCHQEAGE